MKVPEQINKYINSQNEPKKSEMQFLHDAILQIKPECKLWFLDGKNDENKVVANPNIGYGACILKFAKGRTKEFYQIGVSANTTGISVYVFGIDDKKYLVNTFGKSIGKATVTGYCIKFKTLQDIQVDVLLKAIEHGLNTNNN